MMKRVVLLSGVAAIVLGSGAAMAASDKFGHGHMRMQGARINFEEVDANKDGKVTPEELAAHKAAKFNAIDTDGNGSLSAAEMKADMLKRASERADKMTARVIDKRDANGDGELSMDEMEGKRASKMLERLDTDKDGAISAAEFDAMKGKHRGERKSD